ncbi:MAG: hypothetical protein KZQ83_04105 [gamma proteobacterium symbiont of Taylorina sp.]|nr:hypothetical protein [gamma proteobacterium symbiont of Taylorina sp.]
MILQCHRAYIYCSIKFLLFFILPILSLPIYAASIDLNCSVSAGDIVINEIQSQDKFIEFYVNNETDINGWLVYIDDSNDFTLGSGVCNVNDGSVADNDPTTTWPAGTFIVCNTGVIPSKAEVLLTDNTATDNASVVIDYIIYGKPPQPDWSVTDNNCSTEYPDHSAAAKDIARIPDGTGELVDNGTESTPGTSNSGGGSTIDHYSISYISNPGITCEANTVIISAHDDSHALVVPAADTRIDLSTSSTPAADGDWSKKSGGGSFAPPNHYTFDGVESSVQLWLRQTTPTVAPHINIGVSDGTALEDAGEDEYAQFSDTAFRFFDVSTGMPVAINAQIAGKPSYTAPDNQTLELRAVQTNTTTQACEAVLAGTTAVNFAYECKNPSNCSTSNLLTISAAENKLIQRNNDGSALTYTSVNMTFDSNGRAPFSFNYKDAGQIKLHVKKTLVLPAATLEVASGAFVVRPFGFDLANLSIAVDAEDANVFAKAGDDFITILTAKVWGSGQDTNIDGVADDNIDLSANAVTPNFGHESMTQTVSLSHTKRYPTDAAASDGVLSGDTSLNTGSGGDFSSGVTGDVTLSWSEVGIIDLNTDLTSYLSSGKNISTSKNNVGRFTPHHFDVIHNLPDFADSCTLFTYLEQPFYYNTAPVLTVTAKNKQGNTTINYDSGNSGAEGFWKLNSILERSFLDGHDTTPSATLSVTSAGSITLSGETDFDGIADIAQQSGITGDEFSYNKNGVEIPFNADIDITYSAAALTDDDGVCYDPDNNTVCDEYNITISEDTTAVANELRYGRLIVDNAYGSEYQPLSNIRISSEYYNGVSFTLNLNDNCTLYDAATDIDWSLAAYSSNFSNGDISGVGSGTLSSGLSSFTLDQTSTPRKTGYVDYIFTADEWLKFNWDNDNGTTSDTSPAARASFGIFNRSKRLIYTREVY